MHYIPEFGIYSKHTKQTPDQNPTYMTIPIRVRMNFQKICKEGANQISNSHQHLSWSKLLGFSHFLETIQFGY